VLDQERVHGDPVPSVDRLPQRRLGLLRRARADDPQSVRDPVDVGVDGDRRDPVTEDENAVRGLRPDAGQGDQLIERLRNRSPEPLEDFAGDDPEHPRLHPVESGRADERLDLRATRPGEGPRIGEPGEQPRARDIGVRVPCPLGEDRSDEHLERVLGMVTQVRASPVPGVVERTEPVEQTLPVERSGRLRVRHPAPLRPPASTAVERLELETPGSERSGSSTSSPSRRSSPTR
jgi:hypothetical protein